MDYKITKLPNISKDAEHYNTILVVVDRLTKMVHLIPSNENETSIQMAHLLQQMYSVITDFQPVYIQIEIQSLLLVSGLNYADECILNTAFHPLITAERTVQTTKQL